MLHDELPHVIFQSYTLSHFKKSTRNTFERIFLMRLSCRAVWTVYGNVFRAGGYTYRRFLSDSMKYLRQSFILSEKMRWSGERIRRILQTEKDFRISECSLTVCSVSDALPPDRSDKGCWTYTAFEGCFFCKASSLCWQLRNLHVRPPRKNRADNGIWLLQRFFFPYFLLSWALTFILWFRSAGTMNDNAFTIIS